MITLILKVDFDLKKLFMFRGQDLQAPLLFDQLFNKSDNSKALKRFNIFHRTNKEIHV